ncbi:MAG: HMA2 domain-containing protein [Desulfobaccales bacterium]
MTDSEIRIVHAIPGRVRLKVARLRENPPLARVIQERLGAVRGIQGVEATPLTGSVLVLFDPQAITSPESLATLSETLTGLFPGPDLTQLADFLSRSMAVEEAGLTWSEFVVDFLVDLNARLGSALGGLADFRLLVPLALVVFGLPRLLNK